MNVYLIDAGEQQVVDSWADWQEWTVPIHGYERVFRFVAAETRGRAKVLFIEDAKREDGCYLEWTEPMSIHVIAKNQDVPEGILHPYWDDETTMHPYWGEVQRRGLLA